MNLLVPVTPPFWRHPSVSWGMFWSFDLGLWFATTLAVGILPENSDLLSTFLCPRGGTPCFIAPSIHPSIRFQQFICCRRRWLQAKVAKMSFSLAMISSPSWQIQRHPQMRSLKCVLTSKPGMQEAFLNPVNWLLSLQGNSSSTRCLHFVPKGELSHPVKETHFSRLNAWSLSKAHNRW